MKNIPTTLLDYFFNAASEEIAIRRVIIDEVAWFYFGDVCAYFGLLPTEDRIETLPLYTQLHEDEVSTYHDEGFSSKFGKVTVISGSGLYKAIMLSNTSPSLDFKNWLAKRVLPAIRSNGDYCLRDDVKEIW